MKRKDFLKDKLLGLILLLFAVITIEIFLIIYPVGFFLKIYIPIIVFGSYFIGILIEYYNKKRFYEKVFFLLNELEEKYLITELIKKPQFVEGKLFKDILEQTNKAMIEKVNQYKYITEDYKEYIELWIHEIKLPLAASKLIIENNKNKATKSIDEELDKVENYIEQALYYARSNTVEKDYYIKQIKLEGIINECIKKNKNVLIQEKIKIHLHNLDILVNTDSKWLSFIVNQILQNSIKYRELEGNSEIEIYASQGKENVILYLKDNGMGIKESEIKKVFNKGFTGSNGRILNKKSTGIGLYLCQKLCHKLGIAIELNSRQGEGTEVKLIFPKGSYMNMDKS